MKEKKRDWAICAGFPVGLLTAYVINYRFGFLENIRVIRLEMAASFCVIAGVALYLLKQKKTERYEVLLWSLIAWGLVMRTGYMLYTGCQMRAHDLWELEMNGGGHAGYILTILQSGKLPDTNFRQYYQQPFFYLCGSAVSWLVSQVTGCQENYWLVDAAKLVSCYASGMVLLLGVKILKKAEVSRRAMLSVTAFLAFCPAFYLTGGSVAPDALTAFFIVFAFYYTLLWEENHSWKNTLLLAAGYGMGMMTKISCGTIALLTAAVFIHTLWRETEKPGQLIRKYLVFAGISAPMGLWYSLRNLKKFGQSLNYVLEVPHTSELYCGDHSLIQRFCSISLKEFLCSPYANPVTDYNYPVYLLKSSLFGEFRFEHVWDVIPILLLFGAAGMSIWMTAAIVRTGWNGRGNRTDKTEKIVCQSLTAFLLFLIAGVCFCVKYPVGCSMDFRYMTVLAVFAAPVMARFYEKSPERWKMRMEAVAGWYSVFSCMMYFWAS